MMSWLSLLKGGTDQCKSGHDDNRRSPSYESVGQNFAMTASSLNTASVDMGKFVQMWYDEVKDFASSAVGSFTVGSPHTGVIGHYTQVVWAKTKKVGCGFVQFENNGMFQRVRNLILLSQCYTYYNYNAYRTSIATMPLLPT